MSRYGVSKTTASVSLFFEEDGEDSGQRGDIMSFSKYENEYVKLLNGSDPEVSRTTIIYERELQIDNKDAFQFGLVTQQENVGLGAIITLIRNGSDMFVLTGMAINEPRGEFIKYKGLFELIASTVKFY